jgi:phosphatidylserine decarboxylase
VEGTFGGNLGCQFWWWWTLKIMCSSIHESLRTPGYRVKKGEEIGMFQFGGSSIIVGFEKDRIIFDQDLEDYSMKRIMVDVEVGMSLGRASKS